MTRATRLLHRDNPDQIPLNGNIKVTRQDWLNAALEVLIEAGEKQVKVLLLSERLGVSRSSFYWYFKSRSDLTNALLQTWFDTNPRQMIAQAAMPAGSICEAICNIHKCVVDPALFDIPLDFAVRDWARRDPSVQAQLSATDRDVTAALAAMFERFDYDPAEAVIRARVLYYMQLGYNAAELNEPWETRLANVSNYLLTFTGRAPLPKVVEDFGIYVRAIVEETEL